jgi:hypothetical protein
VTDHDVPECRPLSVNVTVYVAAGVTDAALATVPTIMAATISTPNPAQNPHPRSIFSLSPGCYTTVEVG